MTRDQRLLDTIAPESQPPRSNGELVFAAPWEGRVFGLAIAAQEAGMFSADEFRDELIAAIGEHPDEPYYESWTKALAKVSVSKGLLDAEALDARTHDVIAGTFDEVH